MFQFYNVQFAPRTNDWEPSRTLTNNHIMVVVVPPLLPRTTGTGDRLPTQGGEAAMEEVMVVAVVSVDCYSVDEAVPLTKKKQGNRKDSMAGMGANLRDIDWSNVRLEHFEKNFYMVR